MFDSEHTSEHVADFDVSTPSSAAPDSHVAQRNYKSPRARRAQNNETALCLQALEATFGSRTEHELGERMRTTVWGAPQFDRLPKFRKAYVQGYVDGMSDAVARVRGKEPSKRIPEPPARVPKWVERLQPGAKWRRHALGGGWVSDTAYVEQRVYVGPNAAVFDRARVLGSSKVTGEGTVVFGDAEVWGTVTIQNGAVVSGSAQLTDACVVSGVEIDRGRVDGRTVLRSEADLSILTARAKTLIPPAFAKLM
jgi:hypothetical protein